MISYSLSVRSAQPGLCKEEVTETRVYGTAVMDECITLEQFSKHIANHGSVYGRADVQAILTQAVDCMRELLLEGKKIRLGELGDFTVGLSTRGAATPADFTTHNILDVHVNWTPGKEFKNLRKDAEFNLVPIRKEVAELLRKQKGLDTEDEDNDPGEMD